MSAKKKKSITTKPIVVGSYWAAKYRLSEGKQPNGDVIAARVISVHDGRVTLHDLPSGREREKQVKDLLGRNHEVTEEVATRIAERCRLLGKHAARELAVIMRADRAWLLEEFSEAEIAAHFARRDKHEARSAA